MNADWVKAFLLGVIAALLAVVVFSRTSGPGTTVLAADGGGGRMMGSAEGVICLLGEDDHLFIVDARNKRILAYDYKSSSGEILLKAGRNYAYDLRVPDDFSSKKGVEASRIKKELGD